MLHAMILAGAGALALAIPLPGTHSGAPNDHAPVARQSAEAKPDIVDTAVAAGGFKILVAAVKAAGLVETLKGDGPFTVLAPTDEAFAKLPKGTIESLLQPKNRELLTRILTYHVIPAGVDSTGALQAGTAKTVQGGSVTFRLEGGRLMVNDAAVVANDIGTSNGVIHAIDTVLMPPQPIGRLVIGFRSEAPGAALAAQLRLDKHQTRVITSVTEGSEAEKAGLIQYDILVAVDGKPATENALAEAKARVGFGGTLELTIIRGAQKRTITTKVGAERKG